MLTTVRILVAKHWKKKSLADIAEWENKCWFLMTMRKPIAIITFRQGNIRSMKNFTQIWKSSFTYWNTQCP